MGGALRRALPMAPQRHLVVRDALDALAGPAIRPRVPRQQGQVCRAFGALRRGQMQRASDGDSRGAPPPDHLFPPQPPHPPPPNHLLHPSPVRPPPPVLRAAARVAAPAAGAPRL